jgi:membrane-bound metal-dependent hydrolase YbcI (DUF457 family)
MTFYEHAMMGATLALAAGAQRQQGWGLVATAAVAAALPDWDGVSLLLGGESFAKIHRTWGHNLLAASLAGAACGILGYLCHLSSRVRRDARALLERLQASKPQAVSEPVPFSAGALGVWFLVGMLAALSHLPADLIYGGSPGEPDWPVKLLWPFSSREWAWPILAWGDLVPAALFVVEMFALYRWPARARLAAGLTVLALAVYLIVRAAWR